MRIYAEVFAADLGAAAEEVRASVQAEIERKWPGAYVGVHLVLAKPKQPVTRSRSSLVVCWTSTLPVEDPDGTVRLQVEEIIGHCRGKAIRSSNAERIALRFGGDGAQWELDRNGVKLLDALDGAHTEINAASVGGNLKFMLPDGSCIVVEDERWGIGMAHHPGCFCLRRDVERFGHRAGCPAPGDILPDPTALGAKPPPPEHPPRHPEEGLHYACPECGRDDEIYVAVTTMAKLGEGGTDANCGDHEWDMTHSAMECWACSHTDAASAFRLCAFCQTHSEEDHKACREAWALDHEPSSEEDAKDWLDKRRQQIHGGQKDGNQRLGI